MHRGGHVVDWSDIQLVLAIAREGSLSGAARELGINYSTVFRRLNAVEKRLSVRFFERSPNRYVMTEAGRAVMENGEIMEEQAMALARELLGQDLRLQGTIRLTAPEGVTHSLLAPHLGSFCRDHPEITIETIVTSNYLRLSYSEADIAVRCTRDIPENYIGRELCKFRFCGYASMAYVEEYGDRPLEEQLWIMDEGVFFPWKAWRGRQLPKPVRPFNSDSTLINIQLARLGTGIIHVPCCVGDREPELVRFGEPPEELTLNLWVLIHPDLRQTARVKALRDHLVDRIGQEKDLIEGRLPHSSTGAAAQRP